MYNFPDLLLHKLPNMSIHIFIPIYTHQIVLISLLLHLIFIVKMLYLPNIMSSANYKYSSNDFMIQ